jgi:hypothetical protein
MSVAGAQQLPSSVPPAERADRERTATAFGSVDESGTVRLGAAQQAAVSGKAKVSGSGQPISTGPVCSYSDQTQSLRDFVAPVLSDLSNESDVRKNLDAGNQYVATTCPGEDTTWQFVDPNAPAAQAAAAATVAYEQEAREMRLPMPRPRLWPGADRLEVGIETWLHVDSDDPARGLPFDAPLRVQADTTDVWVSAEVRATRVVWAFHGDARGTPDPVPCAGAGKVWQPGLDEHDPGRCVVRFFRSGSGAATVTITYAVRFAASTGPIPEVQTQRVFTFPFEVQGHEAVIR